MKIKKKVSASSSKVHKKVVCKPGATVDQRALAKAVNNTKAMARQVTRLKVKAKTKSAVKRAKIPVTIRLDAHLVDQLRATGAGWQTRLHEFIERAMKVDTLYKVLSSWGPGKDNGMMG